MKGNNSRLNWKVAHGLHGLARINRGNQQAGYLASFSSTEFSVSPKMISLDNLKYLALIR